MSFPPFNRAIERRMHTIGVLLVPVALFVLLSLVTYAETDYPNSSRSPDEVVNLGGRPGALLSYGIMLVFGYGGYVLPLLISMLAWNRIRGRRIGVVLAQAGWLLALMTISTATGSLIPIFPETVRFRIGGVLGFFLGGQMAGRLGMDLSLVLGGVAFLAVLVFMLYRIAKGRDRRPDAPERARPLNPSNPPNPSGPGRDPAGPNPAGPNPESRQ